MTVRDVTAGHRRERRFAELSSRDPDTGLLNHREFEERLGAPCAGPSQAGRT